MILSFVCSPIPNVFMHLHCREQEVLVYVQIDDMFRVQIPI